ncbi:hypothetical protein [Bradyrhizobium sp. MOS002]|uniref:hypothetical protein n=1 Tax=Bradyrhizobium sp. MOS002 TaxID=2133947 RepID=UPI000D123881|nr:hypothetical protein [Bradyrhizobium sp. MOS002]PSO26032.1 hypothetical protein C7G41_29100 [Bradyrhizobium sp. MOS002]
MGKVVSYQMRRHESLHPNLQSALKEFEEHKTLFAAQKLRETLFPDSEVIGHYQAAQGRWVAEIRYDHLIHEAEGPTLAVAIANVVREIIEGLGEQAPT